MTYQEVAAKLGSRMSRKVGNNTYLMRIDDDTIALKLHYTNVVTYKADGCFRLNSGGWRTVTTKERMNRWTPSGFSIYQKKWNWYITTPEGTFPYEDGDIWKA